MDWMIYGANGYTGEITAREAVQQGLKPVLAGRNRERIETLAQELGLESRVFALDDPDQVLAGISGMKLVLHCAGPFSATSAPMAASTAIVVSPPPQSHPMPGSANKQIPPN